MAKDQTVKEDAGKPELSLIIWHFDLALDGAAKVRMFSRDKKGRPDDSWRDVERQRWVESLLRHAKAVAKGETLDPESGEPHIDHLQCSAMVISQLDKEAQ